MHYDLSSENTDYGYAPHLLDLGGSQFCGGGKRSSQNTLIADTNSDVCPPLETIENTAVQCLCSYLEPAAALVMTAVQAVSSASMAAKETFRALINEEETMNLTTNTLSTHVPRTSLHTTTEGVSSTIIQNMLSAAQTVTEVAVSTLEQTTLAIYNATTELQEGTTGREEEKGMSQQMFFMIVIGCAALGGIGIYALHRIHKYCHRPKPAPVLDREIQPLGTQRT